MKRLLIAVSLSCLLFGSALAGDMPTGGVAAPTNEPQTNPSLLPGEIPTDGISDQLSNEALSALLTALVSVMS